MALKFFKCEDCGQIFMAVQDKEVPAGCGPLQEIVPCSTDAAVEKHVPVCEIADGKVTVCVGSVAHPMQEEHFIEWVALETSCGAQMKHLAPGQEPKVCFSLCEGEEVKAAYAYCNLHGLWKA